MEHGHDSKLYWRANQVLAGGFQTLSKNPNRYPQGIAPKLLSRGSGAFVWDSDENQYIDLVAGLGPILLGHCNPSVNNAVIDQVGRGASFSLGNAIEIEVAELLVNLIPSIETVRFGKNGADVTNAAVRLARHETGRKHVIFCGYHGGHDSYIATTPNNSGTLPELAQFNHQIQWGNQIQLFNLLQEINWKDGNTSEPGLAAIMVEVPPPVYGDSASEESYRSFLWFLRETAHNNGALFILDEVVTGFRKHPGGAQEFYGVLPDLSCFSKAMGNGFSVAALGGNRDIMKHFENGEVFMSTTFGGETIGLAAASVVISAISYTSAWDNLYCMGMELLQRLGNLIKNNNIPALLTGDHSRMLIKFQDVEGIATADELKTLWQQEMIKRGVLAGGPILPMVCYTNEIVNEIMSAAEATMEIIKHAIGVGRVIDALQCPVISDVFAKRYQTSDQKAKMVW